MNVFVSWSGERSRRVADLLVNWMEGVIQAVKPWISTRDIDNGAIWFSTINDQLANTSAGIVCLTQDNKNNPWILFESGALAKGLSSNRVYTLLIDLQPTDIKDPLAQFNHTLPINESIYKLLATINKTLGEHALKEVVLRKTFDIHWPYFEAEFKTILENTPKPEAPEKREDSDMLEDILSSVRGLEKRIRTMEGSKDLAFQNQNVDELKALYNQILLNNTELDKINFNMSNLSVPDYDIKAFIEDKKSKGTSKSIISRGLSRTFGLSLDQAHDYVRKHY